MDEPLRNGDVVGLHEFDFFYAADGGLEGSGGVVFCFWLERFDANFELGDGKLVALEFDEKVELLF